MGETYILSTQVYYDTINHCYTHIFTIDRSPSGALSNMTRTINTPKLSPFKENSPCCTEPKCTIALCRADTRELLGIHEQPFLINFLLTNGYTINTELTKLLIKNPVKFSSKSKLLFVITRQ